MKPQSTETNEMMNNEDGTHIANMCIPLWERIMLGYTTRFDRNYHKWVTKAAILDADKELRCQQERYMKPINGETWESIKMTLDELSKPNKNGCSITITTDSVNYPSHIKTYHIWDIKTPDHNMSIDDVCNMIINDGLCKYWSDLNDKQTKGRKTR